MYNPDVLIKTNQMMQFTVSTGYEVRQISFPLTTNTKPAKIERTTRSGLSGTAVGTQIFATYNSATNGTYYGYGISTDSLGLASGEYLKTAKAPIGSITQGAPHGYHYNFYHQAPMHLIGRLTSQASSATVNVQTRADNGSGGIQAGSQNSVTGTVTKSLDTSQGYRFTSETNSTTVTA
jgi:hypothetical protein